MFDAFFKMYFKLEGGIKKKADFVDYGCYLFQTKNKPNNDNSSNKETKQ